MFLRSLYLQNFRNYKEFFIEFNSHLNLICGPNAQGKTTILEAIYYLMMGRSFRSHSQKDLIQLGKNQLYLEVVFCKYGVDQKLRIYTEENKREIIYNSTPLLQVANLIGIIQGVLMTPDDIQLIKGSPSVRRQFLDTQIAQSDPLYVHYLSRYSKAMKQRNQLFKQNSFASIESWEYEMASAASYIVKERFKKVESLQIHAQEFYTYLTQEKESLNLKYICSASAEQTLDEVKEYYLHKFRKNRSKESILGFTLSGPHKDDLFIGIGGVDARYFSSEGQQRSCVSGLRMGEWKCLKEKTEDSPLLMMDDVGISLDLQRRERLLDQLASLGQVFLTTTDHLLINSFNGSKSIFELPFNIPADSLCV